MSNLSLLTPKEKVILKELYNTYQKHVSLYLDLPNVLADWSPKELKKIINHLQDRKFVQYLPSEDEIHCLCRITPLGLDALRMAKLSRDVQFNKKHIIFASIVIVIGLIVYGLNATKNPSKSFADVRGVGVNEKTKAILEDWIENREEENSDYYTFDLLEEYEGRKTYFVECKMAYLSTCKYNIVFVEVDEKKGLITNVEIAQE